MHQSAARVGMRQLPIDRLIFRGGTFARGARSSCDGQVATENTTPPGTGWGGGFLKVAVCLWVWPVCVGGGR